MTGTQILDLLMSRLGNKTEASLRATCLLEMQLLQETQLEGGPTLPWFTIEGDYSLTLVSGQRHVVLPADFIRQVDDGEKPVLYYPTDGTDAIPLPKMAYDEALSHYGHTATGAPEAYALRGDRIMFFPLPDAAYTVKIDYHKRQSAPTDTAAENAWMKWASDLVIAGTGEVICAQHLQDPELAQVFTNQKITAFGRLQIMDTAREEAGRNRRMG